ncbi:MAG: RDD family protein [Bacteroidia bacterium]
MQTIEINTAQNVKIEYELAGLGQRIFAYFIDFIILIGVALIILAGIVSDFEESNIIFIQLFFFIWFGFYTLISEIIGNGQTLGKKALGIKVIKLNGDEPEFYDYFSRWSMRLIDIYLSSGTIAMLLISSNKNGQRIGDIIAGTSIIRVKSTYGFQLKDILKLNLKNKDDYEFEYPLARNLEEKDVILIKNLLYRKRKYNNKAHLDAENQLVEKIAETLKLDTPPRNNEKFLNKVISEYIILTR